MSTTIGSMGATWAPVTPAVVVRIEGADARRFCNGMFTNDVRGLPIGAWNRSAVVDDRARVGGFLDLLCLAEDRFLAVIDGLSSAAFLERFEKYVLFDRVELLPWAADRWAILGPEAGRLVPVPEAGRWVAHGEGYVWGHRRAPEPSVDVVVPAGTTPPQAPRLPDEALRVQRVRGGIPAFPDDTGERRLPHELGLRDELLSFQKGCYLGQETIHRVDVMGQVRKRLVRVTTPRAAEAGAAVRVGEEAVGELTSPVTLPDGSGLGLCVVRSPHDAPGTEVRVGDQPGRVL